ncbi:MAG: hypothetical protein N3G76_02395, partial [Candidatus Micrarchaeota archaeon]|nr:hypothetical protein [Candidatus Micrarchaeota archaeon]
MELPNIYKGDYTKLVGIPIILVLVSAMFIMQVQPGLELKGGALVTLDLKQPMTDAQVAAALEHSGFKDVSIRTYQLGSSHIAEVEIAHSNTVVRFESSYKDFLDTYDKYSKKQYEILVLKGSN